MWGRACVGLKERCPGNLLYSVTLVVADGAQPVPRKGGGAGVPFPLGRSFMGSFTLSSVYKHFKSLRNSISGNLTCRC